jgi:hypothetical protein
MTNETTIRPDAIDLPPTVPIDVISWMREDLDKLDHRSN